MIEYQMQKWYDLFGFSLLCRVSGSVFPMSVGQAAPAAVLAGVVWFYLNDVDSEGGTVSQAWFGFQFALGFLTVFRTQLAYSRYWEGATLMGRIRGQWFNATSNLFAFCSVKEEKEHQVHHFQQYLVRLVSLLHCAALQQVADMEEECFEILQVQGIEPTGLKFLDEHGEERCFILLQWIQRLIMDSQANGVLSAPAPIISRVFQEFGQGIVNIQDAEKLTTVKFPFPFAQTLSFMLVLTSVVTPIVSGILIEQLHWAVLFTFLSVFSLFSINNIAMEIELPFGDDANDLPLHELQRYLNKLLNMLLLHGTQMPPKFSCDEKDLGKKIGTTILSEDSSLYDLVDDIPNHHVANGNHDAKVNPHYHEALKNENEDLKKRLDSAVTWKRLAGEGGPSPSRI
mmetsp:Transcript_55278/g.152204  ORF Transcript_55278/g.152204 Transcript_55278/m.152204 type:complete len:399 (-) Transcript_55278:218-1414(-)|eukprot:CAMPEP_0119543850 /NCGR_PEP_ID=MMETSP1344-20130328/54379_1 /TAXON_ID=236787 /ORGANISM="Florenciella parvula, Strain CCMP2471" /LENGTH=398 /DNA_ID=CAMNT_0007588247 /DNA_START=138 /DNA_END=1334 /DNA_ORIENTATION=+